MAFPSIAGTITPTNGNVGAGPKAVALPTGITAGETLVCFVRTTEPGAHSFPAGWTILFDDASDASDDQTCIAWKKADGTEGSTVTVTSTNTKFAALTWRVSGAEDPTIRAPEMSTLAVGTGTAVDPTTCTPTGGAKDYLWVWCGAWEGEQTTPPATPPTNYGTLTAGHSGTGGAVPSNCRVTICSRTNNAASENAGACTISVSDDWTVTVLAFHPAAPTTSVNLTTAGLLTASRGTLTETHPGTVALSSPALLTAARGDLTPSGGDVGVSLIQSGSGQAFAATCDVTLTGVTAGSTVLIAAGIFSALAASSITTDKSDTVVIAETVPDAGSGGCSVGAYILNAVGGTTVVTVAATGAGLIGVIWHEVSGVDTFDGSDGVAFDPSTTATDGVPCGTVTPTLTGDKYGFAWSLDQGNNSRPNAGTGMTNVVTGGTSIIGTEYKIFTSTAAFAPTFTETDTGSHMMSGVMVLGTAGAGGGDVSVALTTAGLATAARGTLTETHPGTVALASPGLLTAARGTLTETHPGTVALASPGLLTAARGTLTETHPGTVVLASPGILTAARGILTETHPSTVTLSSPALLTADLGTITGASVDKAVDLTTAGLLTVTPGTLTETHPGTVTLTTPGLLTAARGTLTETHPGTVVLASPGILTAARGTLTETHPSTVTLTTAGLLTASRGTLTETHPGTVALSSPALLTAARGDLGTSGGDPVGGDKAVNLTTAGLLTVTPGTLTETHPSTVTLTTGGLLTATRGTLTETHPGTVTLSSPALLTAVPGTLTETHPSTVTLTTAGILTAARGTITGVSDTANDKAVDLTTAGILTVTRGTLTETHAGAVTLTSAGLATATAGTLTQTHPSTVTLTTAGLLTAARGLLTPSTAITLLGKSATATAGTIPLGPREIALIGLETLTTASGTLIASGGTLEVPLQTDTAIGVAEVRVSARGVAECRVSVTGTAWSVVAEVVGTEAD